MNNKKSKVITKRFFSTVLAVLMAFSLYSGIPGAKSEAAALSNPTKTSLGVVTWDCVYFGSYPQTEIVSEIDSAQIAALEKMNTYYKTEYDTVSASQWEAITGATYDAGGDAIVNGVKYHRITKEDATSSRTASNYYNWTDSTSYHYFRYDRIKWKVLSVNGTDALLLAERGLDTQRYNGDYSDVTWENSTIRSWLNGYDSSYNTYGNDYRGNSFFDRAFSSTEKNTIVISNVANKNNPLYETSGGNNTTDKIYLLSIEEILNDNFGFSISETARDKTRKMKSSTYAKAMGAYSSSSNSNKPTSDTGICNWLLRSPGKASNFSAYIKDLGTIDEGGNSAYSHDSKAVCPALHLNISSSDVWSYAGTISSDGSSTEVDDPKTEEKTTEEKTTEEISTEKKTTEEISTEKKTTEEISTEKKTTEEISTEKKTTEEISTEKKTTEEISTEKKTTEEKGSETQVTEKDTQGNTSTETVYDQKDTIIAVKGIKLTGISKKIAAGRKITLTPVFTPSNCSNKNLIWKSSNTNYATVSDKGVVYTKKKGAGKTVTITAVSADGKGVQGVYKIKIVKHAVKKIKLKAQSTSVTAGKNLTVKANVKTTGKTANKTLVWSSSNRSYATVTKKGVVKTKKAGKGKKVTITAKATDGTGKKAKIKIKIK
ncbi:MAG: Ig-like domain-containing protein [Lachnospiraceae bacterium]|nr:Ig-like domain-containing protein [Lachnospiraceae bacterium]